MSTDPTTACERATIVGKKASRRAMAMAAKPIPCYAVEKLPPKKGGEALYEALRSAVASKRATLITRLTIPPRDARSWHVPAGCLFRIVCTEGPQVADMNCWSSSNTDEHFYASKTRQIHATHLTIGHRLWSNMPYLRPLATIIEDTVRYGFDHDGASVHDVIGSRCDPYTHKLLTGHDKCDCCHSNLTRNAILDHGDALSERDVHDVLNVFMCTGFTRDTHQYFTKPSPVEVGDYLEFLAETNLLVAASTCPQGDVSSPCGGGGLDERPICFPLGVEVWKPQEGWLTSMGWEESRISDYNGNHGIPPMNSNKQPSSS